MVVYGIYTASDLNYYFMHKVLSHFLLAQVTAKSNKTNLRNAILLLNIFLVIKNINDFLKRYQFHSTFLPFSPASHKDKNFSIKCYGLFKTYVILKKVNLINIRFHIKNVNASRIC